MGWRVAFLVLVLGWSAGAQSPRPGWGATPYAGPGGTGVTFRTWAPNASSVTVAGTFNGWNTTSLTLSPEGNGVWSRDIAGILPGAQYKFVINGSLWRRDPYSRGNVGTGTRNSIVVNPDAFDWGGAKTFVRADNRDLVIYELHVGAFYDPNPGDEAVGRFTNVAEKLDHLVALGINAVELMPVSDFATPTSWGYNPSYPFAVEPSYGNPDELKALVKACHERGIAVFMDMVHNHWGDDFNDWSLWQYDGWSGTGSGGGIFFFEEPGPCCSPWGPRPDYRRTEVSDYIARSFRLWLEEYRMDGFRWDAPKYILFTDSAMTTPVPGASAMVGHILSALSNEFGSVLNIAEDIAGAPGFDGHWDFSYHATLQNLLAQGSDTDRNIPALASAINRAPGRVIYSESHDTTGDLNNGRRLPVAIDASDPESYFARKRSALGAVFTLTAPGIPMIWMGQEMLATNVFGDRRPLDWSRTNTFVHVVQLYQDLIRLRRNMDGVTAGLSGNRCEMLVTDNSQKVIGYRRYDDEHPEQDVVVLANLRNTTRQRVMPFPRAGAWYVHINTDASTYGPDYGDAGPAFVVAAGSPPTAEVTIGPYSALILSQQPLIGVTLARLDLDDAALGNGNGAAEAGEIVLASAVVSNRSGVAVSGATVELRARDSGVTVLQPLIALPELAAGQVATGATRFAVAMPHDWACGRSAAFDAVVRFPGGEFWSAPEFPGGIAVETGSATARMDSANVPVDILDNMTVYSNLEISDPAWGDVEGLSVYLRINHTWNADMIIALQHPDGTEVTLANQRGGSGDNFGTGACGSSGIVFAVFDDGAATAIGAGTSPFAGQFRPESPLAAFTGKPAAGTWRLRIDDVFPADPGALLCWGLELRAQRRSYQCDTVFEIAADRDGDGLPDWWEWAYYGDPTHALADADDDEDGFVNREEFWAGTDPRRADSTFTARIEPAQPGDPTPAIQWPSAPGRAYRIWRTRDLLHVPFQLWRPHVPATPIVNREIDPESADAPWFYRVELLE
ncbi:MAG TPA: alpha-amylase family glycosyl hydrolase [Kiritimatiellia bacterium]|nr:alpha-amylase family glycosyl hydrolase [Kiritimatiellia bacterium]HMO97634.1 alpha-amylase family glycosyl hydrolase [Kiritimatiellia bacterium]HMP97749.1 alpha-amylase family glycosyl hydrolase [Kiritimatiellia bacterium]